ncbi:hypothetical protein IZU99_08595 [Oscillospiraceae bacterium CM]|nr:hypothetical protein IZU99_08595 [Oscillospiraceae bacterium CM]
MAISVCEFCRKPFNSYGASLCADCSKTIDEAYLKARKFIYMNPDKADFISITEETEITEKALSYLINKGRIEISGKNGVGVGRCRACGKEISSGTVCQSCLSKVLAEKMKADSESSADPKKQVSSTDKKKTIPTSFGTLKEHYLGK